MNYEQFIDLVCESMGLDRKNIKDDTSFLNDLGIDSLTLANFIIKLERKYSIKLNMTNVWEMKTMRDAYDKFSLALQASGVMAKEHLL
jgi:acyl carrier protein